MGVGEGQGLGQIEHRKDEHNYTGMPKRSEPPLRQHDPAPTGGPGPTPDNETRRRAAVAAVAVEVEH